MIGLDRADPVTLALAELFAYAEADRIMLARGGDHERCTWCGTTRPDSELVPWPLPRPAPPPRVDPDTMEVSPGEYPPLTQVDPGQEDHVCADQRCMERPEGSGRHHLIEEKARAVVRKAVESVTETPAPSVTQAAPVPVPQLTQADFNRAAWSHTIAGGQGRAWTEGYRREEAARQASEDAWQRYQEQYSGA